MHRELIQRVMGNHEAIVHFPIVLLTTSFIFGVIGILYKKRLFKEIVFWNLLFSLITLAGALYSGYEEEKYVEDPFLAESVELHRRNAWIMTTFFLGLVTWLGWRKKEMRGQEYIAWLALFFIASSSAIFQGTNGYEMSIMMKKPVKEHPFPVEKKELDYGWNF